MNWLCRFFIHRWEKWSDVTINVMDENVVTNRVAGQKRVCEVCGKKQARYVR